MALDFSFTSLHTNNDDVISVDTSGFTKFIFFKKKYADRRILEGEKKQLAWTQKLVS